MADTALPIAPLTTTPPSLCSSAALESQAPAARGARRRLAVRLARDADDLDAVQRLRWQVFFAEMGAGLQPDPTAPTDQRDADPFDPLCDHLLVTDEGANGEEIVVGTYRLLRESVARAHGGFYSAGEFDISVLTRREDPRELLELGRSCVLPAYRTSATIQLLWRGIGEYLTAHSIALMFGCASFPGTDPRRFAEALSYLHHHHLAAPEARPRVHPGKGVAMDMLALGSFDERQAQMQLPPLVKGYLRAGARLGEGAYIDHDFNTIDVCVVMPVELISLRYTARFGYAA